MVSAYCSEFESNPIYWYDCLMTGTDTVFDFFIAFQTGEVSPDDLKFQLLLLFLAPLVHQVVVSKYSTHVSGSKVFKNI